MTDFKKLRESILSDVQAVADALREMKDPDSTAEQEVWDLMTDLQDAVGRMEEWYEELVGAEEKEED